MKSKLLQRLDERPALRASDLNVVCQLFGLRFVDDEQVELYVEDDEWWHFTTSFHRLWLRDLISAAQQGDALTSTQGKDE